MSVRMPAARTAVMARTVRLGGLRLRSFTVSGRLTSTSVIPVVFICSEMLRVVLAHFYDTAEQDFLNEFQTFGRCDLPLNRI